jgi:hypothetical protein
VFSLLAERLCGIGRPQITTVPCGKTVIVQCGKFVHLMALNLQLQHAKAVT